MVKHVSREVHFDSTPNVTEMFYQPVMVLMTNFCLSLSCMPFICQVILIYCVHLQERHLHSNLSSSYKQSIKLNHFFVDEMAAGTTWELEVEIYNL